MEQYRLMILSAKGRYSLATIWQRRHQGQHYEVRTAGHSIRLYKDGVLHSQFNEESPVTGQVWDLLMLPAFFYPENSIQRILVLGVGGGTVIRQLDLFFQPKEIIGVDLDPIHLSIAKRFFGLNKKHITLQCDDAIHWLKSYKGPPFDMIIEDIFTEEDGEPIRAMPVNDAWARRILRNLGPQGLAVLNFTSAAEAKQCAFVATPKIADKLQSSFLLATLRNANIVAAFLKRKSTTQELSEKLASIPALDQSKKSARLHYKIHELKKPINK